MTTKPTLKFIAFDVLGTLVQDHRPNIPMLLIANRLQAIEGLKVYAATSADMLPMIDELHKVFWELKGNTIVNCDKCKSYQPSEAESTSLRRARRKLNLYQTVQNRFDTTPEECLLIDDDPTNREAAKQSGWHSCNAGVNTVLEKLAELGITELPPACVNFDIPSVREIYNYD